MLAFSSDIYLMKREELSLLPTDTEHTLPTTQQDEIVLFLSEKGDKIINGLTALQTSSEKMVPVRLAYESYSPLKSFFINLIKAVKRKHYIIYQSVYTISLQSLYANQVLRGERNAQNAYEWNNKRWQISDEEKRKRWNDLYNSLKTNGFDKKSPLLLMLNRRLGIKDQILQGHHRLGICKELNIDEVAVSFWATHRSFSFMKIFVKSSIKQNC